jgi:hypothetical protein
MLARPKITYFLYELKNSVSSNHPLWKSPLPLHRNSSSRTVHPKSGVSVNYGDYFQAVGEFLKKNHYNILSAAASRRIERTINPQEIREIWVCLEKHGAFYHPARIDVVGADFWTKFVLNVAVSRAGRDCIEKEYGFFEKINHGMQGHFLPNVYGRDDIPLKKDLKLGMFLGEWFDGFHEFHLSRDPSDNTLKIRVWDPERGGFYLSAQQCRELYRQASRILTSCYNVETTEHIFSWHHASGDFIVKLENNTVGVKLITVRRYESALKNRARKTETIMNALLVFFLNLTIRMRLDRLDGTDELAWSDDITVPGTVLGFLEGLAQKPGIDMLPGPIDVCFMYQIVNHTQSDLLDISRTILDTYSPQAPEVPIIRQHLQQHMVVLRQVINDFGGPYNFQARA